jgi:O-antigen/teichoic acid export membrane protein
MDSLVVGHSRGAAQLGVYSLAFTLAFAPLTNFAWQIGKGIFPAAAASPDLETVTRRMFRSLRLAAAVLLPFLPPTLVLAPVVLPAILGPEWKPMVVPFQILVVVGVGHALAIMIGDSLSGSARIAFRAQLHLVWCVGMAAALVVLVRLYGIRGAALAHLALFVPFAFSYLIWGTRLLGTTARAVLSALKPVAIPVAGQLVVTLAVLWGLRAGAGASGSFAAPSAAAAGFAVVAALFLRFEPELVGECRAFVSAVVSRRMS